MTIYYTHPIRKFASTIIKHIKHHLSGDWGDWHKGIAGPSLLVFGARIAGLPLGLVLSILLARILMPAGRGELAIIMLVPAFLMQFVDPGFGNSIIYFMGQGKYNAGQFASVMFWMSIIGGLLALLLFKIISIFPTMSTWMGLTIGSSDIFLMYLSLSTVTFMLLTQYYSAIILSSSRAIEYNLIRLLPTSIQILLVASVALVGEFSLALVVGCYFFSLLVTALASFLFVWSAIPNASRYLLLKPEYDLLKDAFSFGLNGYVARVFAFAGLRLDAFLLAAMMSSADVGMYMVAVALAEKISMLPDSLSTVLFPRVAASTGDDGVNVTTMACRHTGFLVGLVVLGLVALSRPLIILLYGSAYSGSVSALVALLPGVAALSVGGVVSSYITGKGHPEYGVPAAMVSLVANVAANLYLIPRLGILGASLASTISYTLMSFVLVMIFLKMSGARWLDMLVMRQSDFALYGRVMGSAYQRIAKFLA